mmetsp:Transcript_35705/g.54645  ORF Transcript_35705/g.54645 Transcript_35705/m.54645 type:complete len:105 (-) Transcript_35705:1241-1555(-)
MSYNLAKTEQYMYRKQDGLSKEPSLDLDKEFGTNPNMIEKASLLPGQGLVESNPISLRGGVQDMDRTGEVLLSYKNSVDLDNQPLSGVKQEQMARSDVAHAQAA